MWASPDLFETQLHELEQGEVGVDSHIDQRESLQRGGCESKTGDRVENVGDISSLLAITPDWVGVETGCRLGDESDDCMALIFALSLEGLPGLPEVGIGLLQEKPLAACETFRRRSPPVTRTGVPYEVIPKSVSDSHVWVPLSA